MREEAECWTAREVFIIVTQNTDVDWLHIFEVCDIYIGLLHNW